MIFSEFVKKFFLEYIPTIRNFSLNTLSTYQYGMLIFVKYLKSQKINIDNLKIEDLTIDIIDNYIKYLKEERNNSPSTINNRIAILKSFFNYIENRNVTALDICLKVKSIKLLKINKKIPNHFSKKEIVFIINNIQKNSLEEYKYMLIFLILYNCALRATEVCNIKIKDLELSNNKIQTIYIQNGKGGKSHYTPISKELANIIKNYISKTSINDNPENYLFTNRYNNPYTRKGIYYIVKKIYENTKKKNNDATMFTEEIHPHMLRHTKAVNMVEDGININIIKNFLNHEYLSTTEIYARIGDEKVSEIILDNAQKLNFSHNLKTKKEQENLENWLKNNKLI